MSQILSFTVVFWTRSYVDGCTCVLWLHTD